MTDTNSILYQAGLAVSAKINNATVDGITSVDGRIGIGTNPGTILDVHDASITDTTLTLGRSGEVPTIKAGGTNTDLRIESTGAGGWLDFRTGSPSFTSLRLMPNGYVGVGIENPQEVLHVNGDTRIDGNLIFNPAGNTSYFIPGQVSSVFRNHLNSASLVTILNDGKVGIGATTPFAQLTVADSTSDVQLEVDPDADRVLISSYRRGGSPASQPLKFSASKHTFHDGNVGIGTDSPDSKLHIVGGNVEVDNAKGISSIGGLRYLADSNADAPSSTAVLHSFFCGPDSVLDITKDGKVGIGTTSPTHDLTLGSGTSTGTTSTRLKIYRGADDPGQNLEMGYGHITVTRDSNTLANPQGTFSIKQKGSDGVRTAMHINVDGRVGMGTTSPTAKLHIFDNSISNGESLGLVLSNYDYGVGELNQSVAIEGRVRNNGGGDSPVAKFVFGKDSDFSDVNSRDGNLQFHVMQGVGGTAQLTERMRIASDGKVGIGTTTPICNLHVNSPTPGTSAQIQCGDDNQQDYSWLGLRTDSGNTQMWHGGSLYSAWGGRYSSNFYNNAGNLTFHPQAQANKVVMNDMGLGINTGASGPVTEFQVKGSGSDVGLEIGYATTQACMFIQSYNRVTAKYGNLWFNPGGSTHGSTTKVGTKIQLTGDGQGRFGGWASASDLNNGGFNGPAIEIGESGGNGWIMPYDRDAGGYLPELNLQVQNSKLTLKKTGSAHITGTLSVPNNPHYSYRRMTHMTSSGNIGDWSTAYSATGSDFNSTTGVFTAPITGKYLFTFTGLAYGISSSNHSNTWLQVNGTSAFFMGQYSQHSGSYSGYGGSHSVWLNTNDYTTFYHTYLSGGLHSSYMNMSITFIS